MNIETKISPAFEPFLSESSPNDKRDAIVVYQAPVVESLPVRGRLRELKMRLDYVKERAAIQKPVEERLIESYQKAGSEILQGKQQLSASTIGSGILPIKGLEVTRKTLPVLTEQSDVVAVLPNQKIQLIQPSKVNYEALTKQETKDCLIWGLKQLDIPKLWETSKGEHINLAVLDTGVYGEHSALTDRVQNFIVIDPLGRRITKES